MPSDQDHAIGVLDASKRLDRPLADWMTDICRQLIPLLGRGDGSIAVPFGAFGNDIGSVQAVVPREQDLHPEQVAAYHVMVAELAPIEHNRIVSATVV